MGKKWDTILNYQDWCYQRALELFRVMKPGGICLIFGGTRTHHRLVCGFEDAGFEIKDEIQWIYGSGFPKSYNISKGFDKRQGIKREVVGEYIHPTAKNGDRTGNKSPYQAENCHLDGSYNITKSTGDLAKQWDGWGTALKPAQEPIMVCQKPIEKNYCYNIEKYGVGGINIDNCRVEFKGKESPKDLARSSQGFTSKSDIFHNDSKKYKVKCESGNVEGRFPANIIFDEEAAAILDEQTGMLKSGKMSAGTNRKNTEYCSVERSFPKVIANDTWGDKGGASRFFYCAKASTKERTENGQIDNKHPTVKPISLIKYLVKLVTPPAGICLDICEGSGTHARAIQELNKEGFNFNYLGFENDEESLNTANKRLIINK